VKLKWLGLYTVNAIKRYWAVGLILLMVVVHAIVIGYVRSRVARLTTTKSSAFDIGSFRFQPVADPSIVYQFHMHAIVDPTKRNHSEERLTQMRVEILEAAEQLLRQVDREWLDDPAQTNLRDRLMDVVLTQLGEPLVQRVLITDWLKIPVTSLGPAIAEPKADLARSR
jgi:hypothetical protein